MKIKLSYVGYLKFNGVKSGDVIDVEDGATPADVLTRFNIPRHQQKFITPFVNEQEQRQNHPLKENDSLTLVIQIGGGRTPVWPSCPTAGRSP